MKKIEFAVAEREVQFNNSHYTFYTALLSISRDRIRASTGRDAGWAKWDTSKKNWKSSPPVEYGAGFPDNEDATRAWAKDFGTSRPAVPIQDEYVMTLAVYEDGSGHIEVNDAVTLEFPSGSFNISDYTGNLTSEHTTEIIKDTSDLYQLVDNTTDIDDENTILEIIALTTSILWNAVANNPQHMRNEVEDFIAWVDLRTNSLKRFDDMDKERQLYTSKEKG